MYQYDVTNYKTKKYFFSESVVVNLKMIEEDFWNSNISRNVHFYKLYYQQERYNSQWNKTQGYKLKIKNTGGDLKILQIVDVEMLQLKTLIYKF